LKPEVDTFMFKPPMNPAMWKTDHGKIVGGPVLYVVTYSPEKRVLITYHDARVDGDLCRCWQTLSINDGVCSAWTGNFSSAEEAYQKAA
jgi:hypothetical protein